MKSRIMYLENKETGEARIGRVTFSRTFQTIYYKDKIFHRAGGEKIQGNYFDVETREEYWISGCKKKGSDYHWSKKVPVAIDDYVKEEYWTSIRSVDERIDKLNNTQKSASAVV